MVSTVCQTSICKSDNPNKAQRTSTRNILITKCGSSIFPARTYSSCITCPIESIGHSSEDSTTKWYYLYYLFHRIPFGEFGNKVVSILLSHRFHRRQLGGFDNQVALLIHRFHRIQFGRFDNQVALLIPSIP